MDLPTIGQPLDVKYLYTIANELNTLKTYVVNRSRLSSLWNSDEGFTTLPTSDVSIWTREISAETSVLEGSRSFSFGGSYFQKPPAISIACNKDTIGLWVRNVNTAGFQVHWNLRDANDTTPLRFSVIAIGIGNNMAS